MTNVLCHGCFDVLHVGHIRMLRYAKAIGDRLIVSVAGDEHVRAHKGAARPVNKLADRIEVLASMRFVDAVISDVVLPGVDEVIAMVALRKPDIYVKGAEYNGLKFLPEAPTVEHNGGRVVFVPMERGYSTTNTIARMSA